jgi:deoxyribodipyrimidine photolyase-related protein
VTSLRLIMGDQLTPGISALQGADKRHDVVLMVEVASEIDPVPHHRQKIVLVLAAMRHFAAALRRDGYRVDYVALDDPANSQNFTGEVARALQRWSPARLVTTAPGDWRVAAEVAGWQAQLGLPVEIRADDRFVTTPEEFAGWARGRRELRMEYFYREVRRKTGLLMRQKEPEGGAWNFDHSNRKPLPKGARVPPRQGFAPDPLTRDVMALVERRFPRHFGALEGFAWAVTREQALAALAHFIAHRLPRFGDYQDAMQTGEEFLFHSLLSPYLNVGLLEPLEVCRAAEAAWREGHAPLNAVEGFIRQIIGWREYVRGLYWLKMPDYRESNALQATRPLPDFYWTGETQMACIAAVVRQTHAHAYAHHIQRLMVTGNFALLAGLSPQEVERWYLAVYIDAFEWVELPNTHGMALYADGGLLASKPYAASGAYIHRMSDYCRGCRFSPAIKEGEGACPFNYLYWSFLITQRPRLEGNHRLAMIYRSLDAMAPARQRQITQQAAAFLESLRPADPAWGGDP